jgi:hypothetical protein
MRGKSALLSLTCRKTDPLIRHFEEILADPEARPATKVAAGKELAKVRERQPVLDDPLGQMRSVVEKYAPEVEGMEGVPPDPMRDLNLQLWWGARPILCCGSSSWFPSPAPWERFSPLGTYARRPFQPWGWATLGCVRGVFGRGRVARREPRLALTKPRGASLPMPR